MRGSASAKKLNTMIEESKGDISTVDIVSFDGGVRMSAGFSLF